MAHHTFVIHRQQLFSDFDILLRFHEKFHDDSSFNFQINFHVRQKSARTTFRYFAFTVKPWLHTTNWLEISYTNTSDGEIIDYYRYVWMISVIDIFNFFLERIKILYFKRIYVKYENILRKKWKIFHLIYFKKIWTNYDKYFEEIFTNFEKKIVWKRKEGLYRVIHLKCPKRQAFRRVKDAFNPPTKFAMWLVRHREIHGYFFSLIGSVLNEIRNIKDEKWFWQ